MGRTGRGRGRAGASDGLLVMTPTFHPEQVGTPHYVTDLVRDLHRQGRAVRVVTNMPYYPHFRVFEGYGRHRRRDSLDGNVDILRLPTIVPRQGHPLGRAVSEANLVFQVLIRVLTRRIRRHDRVLAVSPGVPLAVLAASLLVRPGGRLVTIVHDVAHGLAGATVGAGGGAVAKVLAVVERWCLDRSDVVTVLSQEMGDALRDIGVRAPIEVVPLWPTIESPDGIEADPDLVLYSGNLGAKQGIGMLIAVADHLAEFAPGASMVIRGQGSERRSLEAAVAARSLGNVTVADFVSDDELAASLAEAAVHVVPQLPEGAAFAVPSKIYNILAVGRPVVVTAETDSMLATLAQDVEAVRVVAPGDDEGFAAEIAKLLSDDDERRRIGDAAREWMARTHSRAGAVKSYLELLG